MTRFKVQGFYYAPELKEAFISEKDAICKKRKKEKIGFWFYRRSYLGVLVLRDTKRFCIDVNLGGPTSGDPGFVKVIIFRFPIKKGFFASFVVPWDLFSRDESFRRDFRSPLCISREVFRSDENILVIQCE